MQVLWYFCRCTRVCSSNGN